MLYYVLRVCSFLFLNNIYYIDNTTFDEAHKEVVM